MGKPIRIELERAHLERMPGLTSRGMHEFCVRVTRGHAQLANPWAFGKDLRECVARAVGRARETIRAARAARIAPATGWPACGELEAANV